MFIQTAAKAEVHINMKWTNQSDRWVVHPRAVLIQFSSTSLGQDLRAYNKRKIIERGEKCRRLGLAGLFKKNFIHIFFLAGKNAGETNVIWPHQMSLKFKRSSAFSQ